MHFRELLQAYGPIFLFFVTFLETIGVPVPSEVTLILAGMMAGAGHLNLPLAMVAVVVGGGAGAAISYWVGARAGTGWLYGLGRRLRIKEEQIRRTEAWFQEKGYVAVFIGRFIPFVRCLVGYPAGMARMPLGRYLAYSMAGYGIWGVASLGFGYVTGGLLSGPAIRRHAHMIDEILVSTGLVLLIYLLWRRRRANRKDA